MSFSAITQTYGRANRETHITSAPSLDGPWKAPAMMVRHGGQNSVFAGPDGKLYASFAGADPMSVFRDRPGIVPLAPRNGTYYDRDFVGEPCHVAFKKETLEYFTAVGPWDELTPDFPGPGRRDPTMVKIGDEFFVGFSPPGELPSGSLEAGVVIYRSKDAKNWTAMHRLKDPQPGKLKDWEQYPLYTFREMKEDANWPAFKEKGWNDKHYAWEAMIQRIKGEYYITTWMGGVEGKQQIGAILKSTSGKPEGPYVYHAQGSCDIQYLFEDDDGTVYESSGVGRLTKMNDSLTGYAMKNGKLEKSFYPGLAEGVESSSDCGSNLFKYKGRYFLYHIDSRGEYSGKMYYSDTLKGPFHQFGSIPYGGNSSIAGPDANGIWHIVPQPGGDYPAASAAGGSVSLPLHFEPEANPPVVRYPWEDILIGQAVYQ